MNKLIVTGAFPIQPEDIDGTKHFWNAFGHNETEVSAGWLVRFAQRRGKSWEPFTDADIEADYNTASGGKLKGFRFNRLVEDADNHNWVIKGEDDCYYFTIDFIQRCYRAAPQPTA